MHHEQDMRYMGGVRRFMPVTYGVMLIGTLAIIGIGWPHVWGLSGFFSKDAILESAFTAGQAGVSYAQMAFWFGLVAAALTSFYSWRLIYMTFHGPYTGAHHVHGHDDAHAHHGDEEHGDPHESPWVMLLPLVLLSLGAIFAGWIFYDPMFHHGEGFWGSAIYRAESNHVIHDIDKLKKDAAYWWVFWAPVIVTVAGFLVATFTYLFNRGIGKRVAQTGGPLHSLFYNKWYFDEIYNATLVAGSAWLGNLFWKTGDKRIIDGLGPDGVTAAARWGARRLSAMHTGYLYHYAFVIIGAALIFGAVLYWRAGGAG
jgi:NADH-quinone oxidoreductase subunit L